MIYSYRYDPAASVKVNVARSMEMDGLRAKLAPTAQSMKKP